MTDELSPESRALLDAARAGMSPDADAIRRMRSKIAIATGGAAAGAAAGTKLTIAGLLAVVVVAVGATWLLTRNEPSPARPAGAIEPATPTERRVERAASPAPAAAPAAQRTDDTDDDAITIDAQAGGPPPAERATSRSSIRTPAAPPRPAAAAAAPRTGVDLAREVELVDLAMSSLRRGDPRAALQAVQRHADETTGRGQLAEDAAAIEVEALCLLRDPASARKLAAFDARFPRSAQRTRLSHQCTR